MYQITVNPDTFEIPKEVKGQNPFIDIHQLVNTILAKKQHATLRKQLSQEVYFRIQTEESIPDFVFIASGGLSLPRLPEPVVILPNMKYNSRKAELPFVKEMFKKLGIQTYEFPGKSPFEGAAEVAWFHDFTLLVHAYGYRSSKESVKKLQKLITSIYKHYNVTPPKYMAVEIQSPEFYHRDLAMLAYSNNGCIVQKRAFDMPTIEKLRKAIGNVAVLETKDPFALNGIVLENKIITHVQQEKHVKEFIERISKKKVIEINLSEFEKAGGAAACLVLTIYDPRL
jgi:N-dimethylarginine dimethylaminohydrolase